MTNSLTIASAQLNFTVGDMAGNQSKIIETVREAALKGVNLVVFPEMAITGYPAEDLLFKGAFQAAAMQAAHFIASELKDCPAAALVGGFWVNSEAQRFNCAFLIDGGEILHRHDKHWLPNYGVFDEKRVFTKGGYPEPCAWRGYKLGILICEDIWKPSIGEAMAFKGADILLALNASPFELGKMQRREEVVARAAREAGVPAVYCNLVGGQDELVFDGRSFVMQPSGAMATQAEGFVEALHVSRFTRSQAGLRCDSPRDLPATAPMAELAEIEAAMVLGLRDYVNKNGFKGVVIGLSGGIDSGLTAAIAVKALGAQRVHGILMPSPYTSRESVEDAQALADNLGITLHRIDIAAGMDAMQHLLAEVFAGTKADSTEENIQARLRGNVLMAYSNKHGFMVLTTGNKSEMSVGYATLYGDMCGGYSVLKDVYKTTVFELSRFCNQQQSVIPQRMIDKPPSAELKPDQRDDDTLPPYDVLDAILHGLIEQRLGAEELIAQGYETPLVQRVAQLLYVAEYKRRQAPPGVKITGMAFGRDRRYPITNKWR